VFCFHSSDERSPPQPGALSLVTPSQPPHLECFAFFDSLRPLGKFFLHIADCQHDEICCELLTIALSYPRNDVIMMKYDDITALSRCNQAFKEYQV
jgi:hypothetical protein